MTEKDTGTDAGSGGTAPQQSKPQKTDFPKSQDFREGTIIKKGDLITEDK
jgi:hypothetical protein